LTHDERTNADAAISQRLLELLDSLEVSFVVAYLALPDENRLDEFLAGTASRGLPVFAPIVARKGELSLGAWRPGLDLVADREGVPSPAAESVWPAGQGLVVVPGRVFDTEGGRLGRGLGYYDRFLAERRGRSVVVGTAYECQVAERVPRETHDVRMDLLVTEGRLRDFRAR
jgi:5-formyltetrahydrofolate cyclo-ligase